MRPYRETRLSRHYPPHGQHAERWGLLILLVCWLSSSSITQAAAPQASRSSRAVRSNAIRAIPFDRLDPDARAKAASVIKHTTLYRRLPVQVVDCDPNLFVFLVRHPEVIVNIWQKMDATDMTLVRRGPEKFYAEDGAGTVGTMEFLYGDQDTHVLYAEGSYTGPLTARPIRAKCLLMLKADYVTHKNSRPYVTTRMDMFVNVHNVGVDLLAKTFHNLIGTATDRNFVETANFVTKLSRTTESNGPGVQRLAAQLTGLDPAVRKAFSQHADNIYRKAQQRQTADTDSPRAVVARAQESAE